MNSLFLCARPSFRELFLLRAKTKVSAKDHFATPARKWKSRTLLNRHLQIRLVLPAPSGDVASHAFPKFINFSFTRKFFITFKLTFRMIVAEIAIGFCMSSNFNTILYNDSMCMRI